MTHRVAVVRFVERWRCGLRTGGGDQRAGGAECGVATAGEVAVGRPDAVLDLAEVALAVVSRHREFR
jgi:hypothetical protein